ncbi:MAG: hypothetical protein JNL74_15875 [Fibrobacteres bacterium]|nr:hypothetical protein [Fibrobacterota bacterium]
MGSALDLDTINVPDVTEIDLPDARKLFDKIWEKRAYVLDSGLKGSKTTLSCAEYELLLKQAIDHFFAALNDDHLSKCIVKEYLDSDSDIVRSQFYQFMSGMMFGLFYFKKKPEKDIEMVL